MAEPNTANKKEIDYACQIDTVTKETIEILLARHPGTAFKDIKQVKIKMGVNTFVCSSCRHKCPVMIYYAKDVWEKRPVKTCIVSRSSCDCGYTYIFNIDGAVFKQVPGYRPVVIPDSSLADLKYISGAEAERILESGLINLGNKEGGF